MRNYFIVYPMKGFLSILIFLSMQITALGQNIIIQNQNYQISQPIKVVERIVEKPVFVTEPNYSTPSQPYRLHGFLSVFPSDLGEFSENPKPLIDAINKSNSYGINTWRIPTEYEMRLLIENAPTVGLRQVYTRRDMNGTEKGYMYWFTTTEGNYVGAFYYYTTYHKFEMPRIIRLVSNDPSRTEPAEQEKKESTNPITLHREFKTKVEPKGLFSASYWSIVLYTDGSWKEVYHVKNNSPKVFKQGTYTIEPHSNRSGYILVLTDKRGNAPIEYKTSLPWLDGDIAFTLLDRKYESSASVIPESSLW